MRMGNVSAVPYTDHIQHLSDFSEALSFLFFPSVFLAVAVSTPVDDTVPGKHPCDGVREPGSCPELLQLALWHPWKLPGRSLPLL